MTSIPDLVCNANFRALVRSRLARFEVRSHAGRGLARAAVAITITDGPGSAGPGSGSAAALILTRRSRHLKHHSGQWAFPGGRTEIGESAEQTALRELREEVGLKLDARRILGRLDDFATRSGFVITPVVAWAGAGVRLTANAAEVRSIHRIPIAEFLRPDAPMLEKIPQSDRPVLRMPVGESWIAAPTAALIYQFREVVILGEDTRVAHYEQPFFAWR